MLSASASRARTRATTTTRRISAAPCGVPARARPRLVPVHHKPEPENPPPNANEVPRERNTIKRAFKRFEKTRKRTADASNEDVLFAPTPVRKGGGRRLSVLGAAWEQQRDSAKAKNREAIRALYDDAKKKNAEEDWEGRTPKNGVWIKVPCACGDRCKVVRAAAGGNHSAVLTSCGAVMTTGSNSYGQLGHGDVKRRYAFTRVESLRGSRLVTVDCGEDHTGAVGDAGRLYLWGRGDWGQLGSGDGRSHWSPAPVNGVSVAPPVAREHFRAYDRACDVDENERVRREKEAAEREMGGPNQHLSNADAAAAVTTNPRERTVAMKGKGGAGAGRDVRGALEFGGNQRVASTDDGVRRGVEGMGTRDGVAREKPPNARKKKENNEN